MPFEPWQSKLWKSAFDHAGDGHDGERHRLQNSLRQMRDSVATLVSRIQADCSQLTIHDISHLDALWETADIISGEDFSLNPAETFVFGAAILLHDAALTVSAYNGRLDEIKQTFEWQDVSAAVKNEAESISADDSNNNIIEENIIFLVLRELHAQQAENIATMYFEKEGYLIQDNELRNAFAASIGKIAHSHHWDIERVQGSLSRNFGTSVILPYHWTVNELKCACLLRCADAAHFDRRRAPSLIMSSISDETSIRHWVAQHKMNKLSVENEKIHISSREKFSNEQVEEWWLVYDLAVLLDKEIRSSNNLLIESGSNQFCIKGVDSIYNPRAFSRRVETDQWTPIDTSIKVSDPLRIAKLLGGKRLYGDAIHIPFRELIQNAADAVRARRNFESRGDDWGTINISIEQESENEGSVTVFIDDDGIGMSERVLTGPLIDFGQSFWNSSMLRQEFPGLRQSRFKSIGKFGIGFFSIFDYATKVEVISRRFDNAKNDVNVLEFKNNISRPIIRKGNSTELPLDFSTRIIWRLNRELDVDRVIKFIRSMTSFLDINVNVYDKFNDKVYRHTYDIITKDADIFFDELLALYDENDRNLIKNEMRDRVIPIKDDQGNVFGRGAIDLDFKYHKYPYRGRSRSSERNYSQREFISVGGIVNPHSSDMDISFVGVINGETDRVTRDHFSYRVPFEAKSTWINSTKNKIDVSKYTDYELMKFALYAAKEDCPLHEIPLFFVGGKKVDYFTLNKKIESFSETILPLRNTYSNEYVLRSYGRLGPNYFSLKVKENVFVLGDDSTRVLDDDDGRHVVSGDICSFDFDLIKDKSDEISLFYELLKKVWACDIISEFQLCQIFDHDFYRAPDEVLCLVLRKSPLPPPPNLP